MVPPSPVLVEERLARPGMLIIGCDSHSTGYGCVGAFGTGMLPVVTMPCSVAPSRVAAER